MSRPDPERILRQILQAAQHARDLCAGKSLQELVDDWQARLAFERAMEILSEAVKHLSPDLRAKYPSVDWRGAAGMCDYLSHAYDVIDYEILWNSVQDKVPDLIVTVERMIFDLKKSSP